MKTQQTLKTRRTHDAFYLDEYRYNEPKEMHKFIAENAFSQDERNSALKVCDFGCAAGEFLFHLRGLLPNASLDGVDIVPALLERAKQFVPSAKLQTGSVLDAACKLENQYDKSFLVGVHSIFDEFETCFSNLIHWTRPGGMVYIAGVFNSFPIDVLIKSKNSENYESDVYEAGWNIFSQQSIAGYLDKNTKLKSYSFIKFEITIDLPPKQDPLRSWTIRGWQGNRWIINGLCILHPFYLLKIEL